MTTLKKTATGANSDGKGIGFCVNCKHASLEAATETCATCYVPDKSFTNFVRAADKPESKKCGNCSNNPDLPAERVWLNAPGGFPCSVCANDYFYHSAG